MLALLFFGLALVLTAVQLTIKAEWNKVCLLYTSDAADEL